MSAIATIEERTRAMRQILRNREDHPILAESKRVLLRIMGSGLSFRDAAFAMRLDPEVMYELRRRDKDFLESVIRVEDDNVQAATALAADRIDMHRPGSEVPLPVDAPVFVKDAIGLDPDLNPDIAGDWKRLFLRHYSSTLRRVEALDLSGASASTFLAAISPGQDEYDLEFHREIREIELRFTLALEDRHRAQAIASGKDQSVKMAMKGLDNPISAKYEPKKAPTLIDNSKKTVNVNVESGNGNNGASHNVKDALTALSEAAQGPRRLAESPIVEVESA